MDIYFHEMSRQEIYALRRGTKLDREFVDTFKQPEWCNYPDALDSILGCWRLNSFGVRCKSSCENCEEINNEVHR